MIKPALLLIAMSCLLVSCSAHDATTGASTADAPKVQRQASPGADVPAPVPGSGTQIAADFVLSTNEPSWRASVRGDRVVLAGLDGERTLSVRLNEAVFGGRHVMAYDAAGDVDLRITPRACQDTMSGKDFPFTGKLAFDGGAPITGCARPAAE